MGAAMLTVEDPSFWEDLKPVRFGQLPKLQDAVVVIGWAPLAAGLQSEADLLSIRGCSYWYSAHLP